MENTRKIPSYYKNMAQYMQLNDAGSAENLQVQRNNALTKSKDIDLRISGIQ